MTDDERAAAEMAAAAKHRTVAAAAGPSSPPVRAAFALVRPPGHHAGHDPTPGHQAEGFCFYNSVAVAAGVALASGRASKVAILDWDVHHGNGTQTLLYDEPRVLTHLLHRFGDRWYPYTGGADEVGAGAGVGYNLNVPWVEDALGDADYAAAFALVVEPALAAFAPDLVLVSAGFDAAEGDLQGKMRVTPAGFAEMTARLLRARAARARARRRIQSGGDRRVRRRRRAGAARRRDSGGRGGAGVAPARAANGGDAPGGDARAGGALARAVGEPARGRRLLRRGGRAAKGG